MTEEHRPENVEGEGAGGGEGETPKTFQQELVLLLNRHSMETFSGTPDWILGEYLMGCLQAFDVAVKVRTNWAYMPPETSTDENSEEN